MIEDEIKARLAQRFLTAQSRWGRWRLNAYVTCKGTAWRLVVGGARLTKRALDIVAALAVLLMFLPVFALLALLVKLDGGPVFAGETRVGRRGREFTMLKFRTKVVDEAVRLRQMTTTPLPSREDPFETSLGGFLRGSSLDEMPQFLNVLKGEMSLVGPRAPTLREVAHYSQADRRRLEVKPGMTCLWQASAPRDGVRGISNRGGMSFDTEVALDVSYVESQSVWLDLAILAKTMAAVLFGRGL